MRIIILSLLLLLIKNSFSQGGPWERPLKMAWSADGTIFTNISIFQDSSGVPSIIKWKGDTLACVFQWFRQPMNSATWDKVAIKFSYDAGLTWTDPTPIHVNGIPSNYQRPFDPTLAVLNSDSLRLYFSSSNGMPLSGLDSIVNTYSAVSSDGINYTFELNPRFDHPTLPVIDPAVQYFNGSWHYSAPAGAPQNGAYHCISSDGIIFTQQSNYPSDINHNWTGNMMLENAGQLRFYGSGQKIWFNASSDGFNWQGYTNTNLTGGDPGVVKTGSSVYLIVYVGEPYNATNFNCGDTLIDTRDGKKYATVLIGTDCWMKQNLNFGKMVPSVGSATLHSDMFNNSIPEKYAMNNDSLNLNVYGGLYEWDELMNYNDTFLQGLCPNGWHVSTDQEWQRLITFSGGQLINSSAGRGGNALKNIGEGFGAGLGANTVGFSAKHSGDRGAFGNFNGITLRSIFWTSTQTSSYEAYHYTLWAENDTIERLILGSNTGFACRCVMNKALNGLPEINNVNPEFKIFPNPFKNRINLLPNTGNEYSMLMNSVGQTIWEGKNIEQQDFSDLPAAIYILKVTDRNSIQTLKLIKQ